MQIGGFEHADLRARAVVKSRIPRNWNRRCASSEQRSTDSGEK
jgi:hypothetical protein